MFLNEFILRKDSLNLIIQAAYKEGYDKAKSCDCDSLREGWNYANAVTNSLIEDMNKRDIEKANKRNNEYDTNKSVRSTQ